MSNKKPVFGDSFIWKERKLYWKEPDSLKRYWREMCNKNGWRIATCIPAYRNQVNGGTIMAYYNLFKPAHDVFIEPTSALVDKARNKLVERVMRYKDWTHTLWLDADVAPPFYGLMHLLQRNVDVVSGLYTKKQPPRLGNVTPRIVWTIQRLNDDGERIWIKVAPDDNPFVFYQQYLDTLIPCSGGGLGFTLISREVMEQIYADEELPPFAFWDIDKQKRTGEDAYFFDRCRENGYQPYVDMSCVCEHMEGFYSFPAVLVGLERMPKTLTPDGRLMINRPEIQDGSIYDEVYYEKPKMISNYRSYKKEGEALQKRAFKRVLDLKPKPEKVLDVGCAYGYLVKMLNEAGIDAEGIDISNYAIDNKVHDKVEVGDIRDIKKPSDTYDVVTCLETLEHLPGYQTHKAVQEMVRVSKKYIYLEVPQLETWPIYKDRDITHVGLMTKQEIFKIFALFGAQAIHDYEDNKSLLFRKEVVDSGAKFI